MYGGEGLAASAQLARERAGAQREDETAEEYEQRLADVRPKRGPAGVSVRKERA
jgi:hypothetical protein